MTVAKILLFVSSMFIASLAQAQPYVSVGVAGQSGRDISFPVSAGYDFGKVAIELGYRESVDTTTWTYSKLSGWRASLVAPVFSKGRWSAVAMMSVYDLDSKNTQTVATPFISSVDSQGNPIWSIDIKKTEVKASDTPFGIGLGVQYRPSTIEGFAVRALVEAIDKSGIGRSFNIYSVSIVQSF